MLMARQSSMRKFRLSGSSPLRAKTYPRKVRTRTRIVGLLMATFPQIQSRSRLHLSMIPCPICHHNLMIVQTRVNLAAMITLPFYLPILLPHGQIAPTILLTTLLRQKEPMASRMEGKGMREHRISQRNTQHSLTAILVAQTPLMAAITPMTTTNSPKDIGRRPAPPNHPKGRLTGCNPAGFKASLAASRGTCRLKGPIFYRVFSRNPFVLQQPRPGLRNPKSFSGYSQARSRCPSLQVVYNHPSKHHSLT